jgi:hypothetical protein
LRSQMKLVLFPGTKLSTSAVRPVSAAADYVGVWVAQWNDVYMLQYLGIQVAPIFIAIYILRDHFCGPAVIVPGYRSRGTGSIPGATRFFWEVVCLERGPLSIVSTIEELLWRKSSGSGLEDREHGRREPLRRPRCTLYPQKLALASPTSGGRLVGIVRSRAQDKEFFLCDVREIRSVTKFAQTSCKYSSKLRTP